MNRKLLLFLASIGLQPATAHALDHNIKGCAIDSECTLVISGCGTRCEIVSVNHAHADFVRAGQYHACNIDACNIPLAIEAACINGSCTIENAQQSSISWRDYKRPGDEGWIWDTQADEWEYRGFTAYDLPQALVKMGRLELPAE